MNSILAVAAPTGMWAGLINWIHSWVGGGYGWTILVLIILVKLMLSPLDYLIKHTSKKSSLIQQKVAPEVAKLRKKYGDNQQMIQQHTQMLYKREGNNMFGSCIVMLLNLVLTCVIFFTLFSSLRKLSSYQAIEQYDTLRVTYEREASLGYVTDSRLNIDAELLAKVSNGETLTEAEQEAYDKALADALELYYSDLTIVTSYNASAEIGDEDYIAQPDYQAAKDRIEAASIDIAKAVQAKWGSVKQNWLWIKNIWVTDGHANPFPDYKSLKSMADSSKVDSYKNYVNAIGKDKNQLYVFNSVSSSVTAQTGSWNGYYLLALISVVLSILSQVVNDLSNKSRNKQARKLADAANPQGISAKIMKLMVPIIMAIFVLTTNAAFGIYVITNSLISIAIGAVINLIIGAVFAKKQAEVDEYLAKEAAKMAKKGGNKNSYIGGQQVARNATMQPLGGLDQSRFNRKGKR